MEAEANSVKSFFLVWQSHIDDSFFHNTFFFLWSHKENESYAQFNFVFIYLVIFIFQVNLFELYCYITIITTSLLWILLFLLM